MAINYFGNIGKYANLSVINDIIEANNNSMFITYIFNGAAANNRIDVVKELIKLGVDDYGIAVMQACENGHLDMFNYLYPLSTDEDIFNYALRGAILGKQQMLIDIATKLGANNTATILYGACDTGDYELYNKYKNSAPIKTQNLLAAASMGGNMKIIEDVMKKTTNYGYGLHGAIAKGNIQLVEYFSKLCKNIINRLYTMYLQAISNNQLKIAEIFAHKLVAYGSYKEINDALTVACNYNYLDIVKILINSYNSSYSNIMIEHVIYGHCLDVAKYLLTYHREKINFTYQVELGVQNIHPKRILAIGDYMRIEKQPTIAKELLKLLADNGFAIISKDNCDNQRQQIIELLEIGMDIKHFATIKCIDKLANELILYKNTVREALLEKTTQLYDDIINVILSYCVL